MLQETSLEIWGKPSRYTLSPQVRAYVGGLPENSRGVEFETDVEPDPDCPPGIAKWSGPRPGVKVENDCAKIKVKSLKNRQRP